MGRVVGGMALSARNHFEVGGSLLALQRCYDQAWTRSREFCGSKCSMMLVRINPARLHGKLHELSNPEKKFLHLRKIWRGDVDIDLTSVQWNQ